MRRLLVGWLVGWLVGCLIDWLIGWLIRSIVHTSLVVIGHCLPLVDGW